MEASPAGKDGWGEGTHQTVKGSLENGQKAMGQASQDTAEEAPIGKAGGGAHGESVAGSDGNVQEKEEGSKLDEDDEGERAELVLFQVKECYVYKIPARKSNLSYRADEWDINKWTWQGAMRIVSKGTACSIRLEDPITGELFAQAPVRANDPLPVEGVVDSSRFFVLRVEDSSGPHVRHAFVGMGFRERAQAYDFNAALQDHLKYVNRKKEADEVAEEYKHKPSADYSLKEGQTLRLEIRTSTSPGSKTKLPGDGSSGTSIMRSLNRGGSLFADQRAADAKGGVASGTSNIGITLPSLPPPPKPGEVLRRPSLEAPVSVGSKTAPGAPAVLVPPIIPPPPASARTSTFSPVSAAPPVSDVPTVAPTSDAGPEDEDFGDFQAA